jgi:hypothetical protein
MILCNRRVQCETNQKFQSQNSWISWQFSCQRPATPGGRTFTLCPSLGHGFLAELVGLALTNGSFRASF